MSLLQGGTFSPVPVSSYTSLQRPPPKASLVLQAQEQTDLRPSLHLIQTATMPSDRGNWLSLNSDEEPQAESLCSPLLICLPTPAPAFKTCISCTAAGRERVIWIYLFVKSAAVCLHNRNSSTTIIKLNFMLYVGNFMAVLINITLVGNSIK